MGVYRIELQSGVWPESQSFKGWVYAEEEGIFYGIAKKSNKAKAEIKYLVGIFTSNEEGAQGIEMYEMSNTPGETPIKYVVPDLEKPDCGSWAEFTCYEDYQEKGEIIITITKDSERKKRCIEKLFEKLDEEVNYNADQFYRIHSSVCEELFIAL